MEVYLVRHRKPFAQKAFAGQSDVCIIEPYDVFQSIIKQLPPMQIYIPARCNVVRFGKLYQRKFGMYK
jgi:hypothetical protein